MPRSRANPVWLLASALLASACVPDAQGAAPDQPGVAAGQTAVPTAMPTPVPTPTPAPEVVPESPPTRSVGEVLESGVVIVISVPSQQMHVLRDGLFWRSSPVSTGKRGKETPPGVFAILQKKKFHRSNLYSNAPMPFMQRLTWDGIAIHAGHLPGYPASHGCIRLPDKFARDLFALTAPARTAVIVTDKALTSDADALALAQKTDALVPISPELLRRKRPALARADAKPAQRLPASREIAVPRAGAPASAPVPTSSARQQTIQLAAALSPELATAQWDALTARSPALRGMEMAVIPAVVNGTQYYRLRTSAPDAHATCKALKRAGIDCFAVS